MPRYIAFLRAINVGGHNVKMVHLRALFEALDFSGVESFIASGNIIFDAPEENTRAVEERIEEHLRASLGYDVATFIRTVSDVANIARYEPFPAPELDAEGNTLYIGFLKAIPPEEKAEALLALKTGADDFHLDGRELYWLYRSGKGNSRISGAALEKTLKMATTLRNANTVRRLADRYSPSP